MFLIGYENSHFSSLLTARVVSKRPNRQGARWNGCLHRLQCFAHVLTYSIFTDFFFYSFFPWFFSVFRLPQRYLWLLVIRMQSDLRTPWYTGSKTQLRTVSKFVSGRSSCSMDFTKTSKLSVIIALFKINISYNYEMILLESPISFPKHLTICVLPPTVL